MAYTQADLEAVQAAIASGVTRVRMADGKMVEYQSVSELLKAEAIIKRDLAVAAASATHDWPAQRRVARYRSGIY